MPGDLIVAALPSQDARRAVLSHPGPEPPSAPPPRKPLQHAPTAWVWPLLLKRTSPRRSAQGAGRGRLAGLSPSAAAHDDRHCFFGPPCQRQRRAARSASGRPAERSSNKHRRPGPRGGVGDDTTPALCRRAEGGTVAPVPHCPEDAGMAEVSTQEHHRIRPSAGISPSRSTSRLPAAGLARGSGRARLPSGRGRQRGRGAPGAAAQSGGRVPARRWCSMARSSSCSGWRWTASRSAPTATASTKTI